MCQNEISETFCHPERSEGSEKRWLMYSDFSLCSTTRFRFAPNDNMKGAL